MTAEILIAIALLCTDAGYRYVTKCQALLITCVREEKGKSPGWAIADCIASGKKTRL